MFNNTNRQGGSIFGGNTTQPQSNIFGGNQQQPQQSTNIFGGNQQQQPQNTMFNNQQQQGNPVFGNQQQQPQQQSTNIFGGNQTNQQKSNIFGGQQQTGQQQQNTIFGGNQQQQATNIFGGNQQQQQPTNIFGANQQQQQQQTNIFANQQQQGMNPMGNQLGAQLYSQQQPLLQTSWPVGQSPTQEVKSRIQEWCRRVDPKHLQQIRIDEMNMYKDKRLGELDQDMKNSIMVLMNNMKELKNLVETIKRENENLDRQAADYCKKVQEKLVKYKEVLIQNIQQSNLLDEVKKDIDLIENQINNVIVPLYNAHKTGKHHSFDSPDEFSSTIARKVLEKMIQLNNKVDQIISCQQQNDSECISEEEANTLMVLEQLLNYYENVSAKVLEFSNRYNTIKHAQIDKNKRTTSYEDVMRRIQDKVDNKMKKDFKCYDLIKEIEDILTKREKREEEFKEKNFDRKRNLQYNDDYSQGWARYGSTY